MNDIFQPGTHHTQPVDLIPTRLGELKRWSYSSLTKFERCKFAAYLNGVKKIREPSGPAAERGTAIHDMLENFVKGNSEELPKEVLKKGREPVYRRLQEGYFNNTVQAEAEWGFTLNWEPTTWDEAWCVFKIDLLEFETPTSLLIRDYKTGRQFGNEMKHSEQCLFYAVAAFAQFPEVEFIRTDIDYIDQGTIALEKTYSRAEAEIF
jgi:RecB family exonuclease